MDSAAIDAIRFPFYGDVLWAAVVQGRAAVPDVAALDAVQQVDPGLPDVVNRRQVAVLQAMAAELGARPWRGPGGGVRGSQLGAAARPAGMGGQPLRGRRGRDPRLVARRCRLLELPGCRPAVQEVVRPALLADPDWVLVGHSLGAVVCAELLTEDEVRARAGVFVAVGAPLGLDAVTDGMRPRARPGRPRPGSTFMTPGTGWRSAHRCPGEMAGCASSWPSPTPAPMNTPSSTTSPIPKSPRPSPTPSTQRTDPGARRPDDAPNPRTPPTTPPPTATPLGDVNPHPAVIRQARIVCGVCWPVLSLQLKSGALSSQCAPVGPSSARWND
jgi:hypothetical protein